ncbi:hypothetical protein [Saccharolobus caldissimus]|uniref:Uncharacterized protein n=1 Tax=Saccharolobus caldissimus TaxID=1702097 RepID=A0AAQ4CUD2_9CREN|nr:hypothetical protein [Saccharolobus caldissimus]BDB99413.1 hypothetical protein SACC_24300 [Saccharolobus caldissimus]
MVTEIILNKDLKNLKEKYGLSDEMLDEIIKETYNVIIKMKNKNIT